jgi:hypothetical protein
MGSTCTRGMQEVYATSDMVEEFTVYSMMGVEVL